MRILYLDLDACSAAHLGCYGYSRDTSPTIDAVAAQGLRCTGVYASDAPCLPSRTALYQGRFGIQTGVVGHGGRTADLAPDGRRRGFRNDAEELSFPRRLQLAGMRTAMVSPFGQRHAAHHFYAGFNEVHNTGLGGQEDARDVQPVVERWLRDHGASEDWYLHVNYWDAHTPYRTPTDFGEPFADAPLPGWFTDAALAADLARGGPHSAQDLGMYTDHPTDAYPRVPARITDLASLKRWVDAYDTAIRYIDDHVARLLGVLRELGVEDEVAIVISADHGENQGELGLYGEHATADHATCRVPFIVRWPGAAAGVVDDALHYQLDWVPTCLAMLGIDEVPEPWDGRRFDATVRDGTPDGRDELILSQCAHVCQRSVRFDASDHRWLYLRTYHDGFQPFPRDMLFDLAADPRERDDLAGREPAVVREAESRLQAWHDEQMRRLADRGGVPVDPLWLTVADGGPFHARADGSGGPPADLPAYAKRLRETGRAAAADALAARWPAARAPGDESGS